MIERLQVRAVAVDLGVAQGRALRGRHARFELVGPELLGAVDAPHAVGAGSAHRRRQAVRAVQRRVDHLQGIVEGDAGQLAHAFPDQRAQGRVEIRTLEADAQRAAGTRADDGGAGGGAAALEGNFSVVQTASGFAVAREDGDQDIERHGCGFAVGESLQVKKSGHKCPGKDAVPRNSAAVHAI